MFKLKTDQRGAVVNIGIILMLVIGILAAGIYVENVMVPTQESEEIDNETQLKDEIREFPSIVALSSATDVTQSKVFSVNVDYSYTTVLPMPDPILNVETTTQKSVDVKADNTTTVTYDVLKIQPDYTRYQTTSSMVYEQQIMFQQNSEAPDQALDPSPQHLINGDTITLYNIDGATKSNTRVELAVYHKNTNTITGINSSNSGSVEIVLYDSSLTADQWRDLLENELTTNGGHVSDVSNTTDGVVITLESGTVYDLVVHTVDIQAE